MSDLKATISTLGLSILANLMTPAVQAAVGDRAGFNLLSYWYLFALFVAAGWLWDLVRIFLDKDKSDLWRGRLALLATTVHPTKKNEKRFIINDLNGRINLARRELHFTNALLPKLVNVEWVDDVLQTAETYDLKEGEFVVRVSNKDSQKKNIVDVIQATTKRTAFVGVRHILCNNRPFEEALDEVVSENIILQMNDRHILDYYYTDHLQPCLQQDPTLRQRFAQAKVVDNLGMFFTIYLAELEYFARRTTGQVYKPFFLGEIEQYLDFLSQITPEKTAVGVDLQFERAFLKSGVLLVRAEKIVRVGIEPYKTMVETYLQRQYHSFYLVYFERKERQIWRQFQTQVDNLIDEIAVYPRIERQFDKHYAVSDDQGNLKEARCLRYLLHEPIEFERA